MPKIVLRTRNKNAAGNHMPSGLQSSRSLQAGDSGAAEFHVLWENGDRMLCRGRNRTGSGRATVLLVVPAGDPSPAELDRLTHEHGLKDELDDAWAVRPIELQRDRRRTMLVLKDPGGEPLARRLGSPFEPERFLPMAATIAAAGRPQR